MTEIETVSDAEWTRDTAMNVMLATEVDEAVRILSSALSRRFLDTADAVEPVAWLNPDNGAIAKQPTRNNTIPLFASRTRNTEVGVKAIEWGKTSYGTPEAKTVVGVYRVSENGAVLTNNLEAARNEARASIGGGNG